MDRLINENAVLSAIGEWIAHNEHTYTNATEYLRNRIKAIKTTEQEPCDCISREEVGDYIVEFVNHEYATDREREMVKHIIGGIQHLPSIQPTTKENLVVEDCISREAVINTIFYKADNNSDVVLSTDLMDRIKHLPSVTPKANWIPVSERLPEEDGFYLATCDGEICGEDEPIVSMAEFENGKWADDEDDYQCVLAWMPLPERYKAESEDKE